MIQAALKPRFVNPPIAFPCPSYFTISSLLLPFFSFLISPVGKPGGGGGGEIGAEPYFSPILNGATVHVPAKCLEHQHLQIDNAKKKKERCILLKNNKYTLIIKYMTKTLPLQCRCTPFLKRLPGDTREHDKYSSPLSRSD